MPATTATGIQYAVPSDPPDIATISQSLANSVEALLADTGWQTLSLGASLVASSGSPTPAVRVKAGVLYWRGAVTQTGGGNFAANASVLITNPLPAGYRPVGTSNSFGKILAGSGASYAHGFVDSGFQLHFVIGPTAMASVNLDGMSGYLVS